MKVLRFHLTDDFMGLLSLKALKVHERWCIEERDRAQRDGVLIPFSEIEKLFRANLEEDLADPDWCYLRAVFKTLCASGVTMETVMDAFGDYLGKRSEIAEPWKALSAMKCVMEGAGQWAE